MAGEMFARNVLFWGAQKQKALENAAVLVAGLGGLGCVVSETLVRAGVGRLVLADHQSVSPSDLNRQILYQTGDVGRRKVEAAAERLNRITKTTEIVPLDIHIGNDPKGSKRFDAYHIDGIADCLDNYPGRFVLETLLPDGAFLVHGGVRNDFGQVTTIIRGKSDSLRDLYAGVSDPSGPVAVVPPIALAIGALMAQEILNNVWDEPQLLGTVLVLELADFSLSKIPLRP